MVNTFADVIDRLGGPASFARKIGTTAGAAKQAKRRDSIAAEWFTATVRAAREEGLSEITADRLAEIAAKKRAA